MNYDTLCSELADDPLGRGYASMTDAAAASSLNLADIAVPCRRLVTVRTLLAELGSSETAAIVQALEAADDPDGGIALAISMLKEYSQGGGLDIGHPNTRTSLDGLVAAEVLTQDQAAALKALAERQLSRAEQLGLPAVDQAHVTSARRIIDGQ